jgi:hypothetical protein
MYLDVDTGDIYQWTGTAWDYQGTFAPTTLTPEEILAMLLTVDGAGSGVDADLLDGQHGDYYATQTDMTTALDDNAAQDAELQAHDVRITTNTNDISALQTDTTPAAILAKIITVDGAGSGLDADTLDGHDSAYFATQSALTTEKNRNDAQDTAIAARLTDAPSDANAYGRKAAQWVDVTEEAPADGLGYMRKNGAWTPSSGGATTDDNPPAGPLQDGQFWWKSSTGVLYLYYVEPGAGGAQWVQVSASPQIVDNNYTRKTARARNRINNPTAQVSQENGTTAVTASGYPADQIATGSSGIVFSGQKVTLATPTPEGTLSAIAITATTAKASLAATDYLYIIVPIEGFDVADFGWGTANAKQVVVRFCAVCDQAGTYGFAITNGVGDRAWCGSFIIAQAGVPQVFTIVVPGDTTGTWPKDNSFGLSLRFAYAYGSNYAGVAGWGTGNRMGVAGTTNGAAVANSKLYITDVGLYADPDNTGLPPPFIAPPYEDDLARCKRYYQTGNYSLNGYMQSSASNCAIATPWGVSMRAAPTMSKIVSSGLATICTDAFSSTAESFGFQLQTNGTGSGNAFSYGTYKASARMI